MHNGERRNPLAGVPWNKYMPFVLVTRVGSRARLPPARGSERNASPTSWEGWEGWLKVLVSARNSRVKKQRRTNSWLGRMTLREPNIPRPVVSLNTSDTIRSLERSTILSAWTYSTPIFVLGCRNISTCIVWAIGQHFSSIGCLEYSTSSFSIFPLVRIFSRCQRGGHFEAR